MASFLDEMNINQMVVDAAIINIQEHLYDSWMSNNLDEGEFYADHEFALLAGDNYLKEQFNKYYNLNPDDENYLEVY